MTIATAASYINGQITVVFMWICACVDSIVSRRTVRTTMKTRTRIKKVFSLPFLLFAASVAKAFPVNAFLCFMALLDVFHFIYSVVEVMLSTLASHFLGKNRLH